MVISISIQGAIKIIRDTQECLFCFLNSDFDVFGGKKSSLREKNYDLKGTFSSSFLFQVENIFIYLLRFLMATFQAKKSGRSPPTPAFSSSEPPLVFVATWMTKKTSIV